MMNMDEIINWINDNRSWLFSGLGATIVIGFAGALFALIKLLFNRLIKKDNKRNNNADKSAFDRVSENDTASSKQLENLDRNDYSTTECECRQIRERLNCFLEKVNENLNFGNTLTITKCVDLIKDQDIYNLFDYEQVSNYELLNEFADYFCLNSSWLKYGEGSPFGDWFNSRTIIDNAGSSFDPNAIVPKIEELDPKGVYFLLVDDGMKKGYIVVKISDFQFKRVSHYAPVDVNQSGEGGKHQLRNYVKICNHFYNQSRVGAYSIDLSRRKDVAKEFRDGSLWLGFVENRSDIHSYWAEDICDYNRINAVTDDYEELYGEWFLRTRKYLRENM